MGIFEGYPVAKWEVDGQSVTFSCISIQESYANRIIQRERPHRDGAKLDDTGSRAITWSLSAVFYLGGSEPGVEADKYPDKLNKLLALCAVHETGTLTVPTRGPVRCRVENYQRSENQEQRDYAVVNLTFIQDNEDNTTAASFTAPSARSVGRSQAEQTVFSAEPQGAWSGDLSELTALAADLEGLINAPFEALDQIESKAKAIDSACQRIEDAFTGAAAKVPAPVNQLLAFPQAVSAVKGLRQLRDTSRRAASDAISSLPRVISRTFPTPQTLVGIAGELGQPFEQLLKLNKSLDPFNVPAGTPVRIYG